MALGIGRLFLRGPVFHGLVRDEVFLFRELHGDQAHAFVVAKLARTDLTSRYRGVLKAVERQLRPSRAKPAVGGRARVAAPERRAG